MAVRFSSKCWHRCSSRYSSPFAAYSKIRYTRVCRAPSVRAAPYPGSRLVKVACWYDICLLQRMPDSFHTVKEMLLRSHPKYKAGGRLNLVIEVAVQPQDVGVAQV